MIGTIRKHSTWMWGVIITATIISFVYWGANPGGGRNGAGGSGNYGTIMGQQISAEEFARTYREMELRFFISSGGWPDNKALQAGFDPNRETYFRILLLRKAAQLGIHVSLDTTAKAAGELLRSMNRGEPVPLGEFVKQVLTPRGLTGGDFERYMRNELIIQQLLGLAGSSGRLVTPQDARGLFEREHQDYVVQAVFLERSNYLSGVTPTPEALGQFFTNQMAQYRIPERLQVGYVKFPATNFFAEAVAQLNQVTNLAEQLDTVYRQRGGTNFYADKTPEAAKQEILLDEQNRLALARARNAANHLAAAVMEMDPVRVENLSTVAQASNLVVELTQPFPASELPAGLNVDAEFVRAAYERLSDAEPVFGPVMGADAAYVIALHRRLPSELPVYENVRDRVATDYTFYQSATATRAAGFALANSVSNALAAGKTFSTACLEAKLQPVLLPAFSLSSTNISEVEKHDNLNQFKQTMFMTPVGRASGFVPNSSGGGYLLFVQQKLPMEEARFALALPEYLRTIRQGRQTDAVNAWVTAEGQRDPGFREIMAAIAKQNQASQPGAGTVPN